MSDYSLIKTSAEVAAVLRASHPELMYFGSFSDPDGRWQGGPGTRGTMETTFGFSMQDFPTLRIRTTWDIGEDEREVRGTRKHEYWLCVGKEEV